MERERDEALQRSERRRTLALEGGDRDMDREAAVPLSSQPTPSAATATAIAAAAIDEQLANLAACDSPPSPQTLARLWRARAELATWVISHRKVRWTFTAWRGELRRWRQRQEQRQLLNLRGVPPRTQLAVQQLGWMRQASRGRAST